MDTHTAYHRAIRILGQREHSSNELRVKLQRKLPRLSTTDLDTVIDALKADDLLSDQRFTEILIRSRINKGYGPYYIQRELASKGIQGELVAAQLELADVDWLEVAKDLIQRRHPDAQQSEALWRKAASFLQRRGFSGDLVRRAVGERPY